MNSQDTTTAQTPETDEIVAVLRDAKWLMLTTVSSDGKLLSHPMSPQEVTDAADVYFFLAKDGGQAEALAQGSAAVNLSVAEAGNWLSVAGTAEIVEDRAKLESLWNTEAERYFPGGMSDPNLALLRVTSDSAQYWGLGSNKLEALVGLVKRRVPEGASFAAGKVVDLAQTAETKFPQVASVAERVADAAFTVQDRLAAEHKGAGEDTDDSTMTTTEL